MSDEEIKKVLEGFKRRGTPEEAERLLKTPQPITTNLLTWLTIHGNLCLALRHPQNKGPSRPLILKFTKELGQKLVEWQVITQQELQTTEHHEQQESPHEF